MESPAARADRLLRDVLGDAQYQRLRGAGYLDLPLGQSRNVAKLPDKVSARFIFAGASAHKV